MRTILFVCSGNTCRSPMAEAIARHWTKKGLLGLPDEVFIASAGTIASEGLAATPETVAALGRWEIEYDGSSKPLTPEMVRKADLVLCMTSGHVATAQALVEDQPEATGRILRLDPETDLEDPIGMGQSAYDALAETLIHLVPRRLKELLSDEDRPGIGSSRS